MESRGHQVTIFDNDTRSSYRGGFDACVNIKSSDIERYEPTLYLTNETDATHKDLSQYDGIVWPSQWADEHIPVNNPRRFIVPHGYDPKRIYPTKKIPKQCFYASSPDRGLETLLRVWPQVNDEHPDATLVITYGVSGIDMPGVLCLGSVDNETMDDIYRTSDIWCHPANGGELFCMTGIKAQAARCWPVIIPTMALSETVRYGSFAEDESEYAAKLIEALNGHDEIPEYEYADWKKSTDILEAALLAVLE